MKIIITDERVDALIRDLHRTYKSIPERTDISQETKVRCMRLLENVRDAIMKNHFKDCVIVEEEQ